jgi:siroheme synthase
MPAKTLPDLVANALAAGLDPATPAVAIERATRADERVIAATIANLPSRLAAEPPTGPVIVMIGRTFAECVNGSASSDIAAARGEASSHKARA